MPKPKQYKTRGVVLKQMPLGEADRVLTIYTFDMGKIRAVGRSVRRAKSKIAGHLEPLTHVQVSVSQGRSLDTITGVETVHSFRPLREDLQRVSKGVYLAELVDSITADESPNIYIFELLLETLAHLQTAEDSRQLMRYFEVQLLWHSGFGPELFVCVDCESKLEPREHLYSCAKGGILCPGCRASSRESLFPASLNAIKVLRFFQSEAHARVAELSVGATLLEELERVLRTYLRYVLDREPKSAEFMSLVASTSWS